MHLDPLRPMFAGLIGLLVAVSASASPWVWPADPGGDASTQEGRPKGECPPECVDGCIDIGPLRSGDNRAPASAWQELTPGHVITPTMTADAGDFLGAAVAVVGDHMIAVAAGENQGNLYFYRRIGGQWVFQSRRSASQTGTGPGIRPFLSDRSLDRMILGGAQGSFIIVRLDGDDWIAEPIADGIIEPHYGRVGVAIDGQRAVITYAASQKIKVLAFDGTTWQLQSEWTVPDAEPSSSAPLSADLQGSRLVIGEPIKTLSQFPGMGRALIYRQDGGAWALETTLAAPEEELDLRFGQSVAIDGDLVAVGAWRDDVGSRANAGSVSVFRYVGGQWTRLHTLTPDAVNAEAGFGWRVMLVGEHLYVSQYGGPQNAPDGGLFEYDLSAPTPAILNHLVEPGFNDLLGAAFDVAGNELMAGTPGRSGRGGIKAFRRVGSGWIPHQVIEQEWSLAPTHFGSAVASDGTHLLVSESDWPAAPHVAEPVVHAYEWREGRWLRVQTLRAPEAQLAAGFGRNVAVRGDLALIARVVNGPRRVGVHAYRFLGGEWLHVDSVDLEPLATTFGLVSGVRFRFVDGGVAIGLEGQSDLATGISHEVGVFALAEDGHFVGWDTLSAPNADGWRGYGPSIAATGDWVAVHDAYGIVTETQIRGVTSIFRRTASGWVRHWDLPSVVAQPIAACGVGATFVAGYVALVGDRLFVAVGSGETATGATRGASIDTYELDPSGPPRHTDARETGSLQVLAGNGRLALFEDGSLTFFDPSKPLSLQSPTAIVPPRTYYRPIVDFSANHVVFGVPHVESTADQYMGEVHVLSLGGAEAAVPFAGRAALFLLMVALLLVGALRSRPERKPA